MTPAQAAWLRKLRDSPDPLPRPPRSRVGYNCMIKGWTWFAEGSNWREEIKPAGLAALAEYEEKVK